MSAYNMIFAGFGGQGVLFTGKVVAYAGMIAGKEVSWLPSYGPEMRGGTANCSVCIADRPIGSPLVTHPNVLMAMNGPSYDKFVETVEPGGVFVYDSTLVTGRKDRAGIKTFGIPATQLSNDKELQGIANIIILGKLFKEAPFCTLEALHKALEKCVPARKAHLLAHNKRAIELGMSL